MNSDCIFLSIALILCTGTGTVYANTACDADEPLLVVSATDDGLYEETHGPENTIDGNLGADSRWSNQTQGEPKSLLLDLGAQQTVKSMAIAWYKGDSRWSEFSVEASNDGSLFETIIPTRKSSGSTLELEPYDFDDIQAQFLKLVANGNADNDWNSLVEITINGCGVAVEKPEVVVVTDPKGTGVLGLKTDVPPGENFDLSGWYVTTPADDDGDDKADSVMENELVAGWTDPRYFYTDPATGGMVFRSTPAGAKTSINTNYTRTELRGMLREGDESIATRAEGGYPNKNNWVFSSAPVEAQAKAAGVDGVLNATLSVNQVTRLGKAYQVGRVIIGQIHAKDDEPIRLYYRKLPRNKYGSIYFAHEPATGKEKWVEVIGDRSDKAANPDDGIALDEVFSYEIEVKGVQEGESVIPMLHVKIIRDDGSVVSAEPYDMRDSGYSVEDDFMFFKAGAYSQNNSSPEPETDFDRVIFYKLDYSHSPATESAESTPESSVVSVSVAEVASTEEEAAPLVSAFVASPAVKGVLVDDSFSDGGRENGADAMDTDWWTTTNSSAVEISEGALGLVSGSSGRGIRTTFAPQILSDGQSLKATFTFTTPATVGEDRDSAFRVGLFDTLGRAELEGDLSASSDSPNTSYDGLPGFMIAFDVNLSDPTASRINILKHKNDTQGRLLGTTKGYVRLASGGDAYQLAPEQSYVGSIEVRREGAGVRVTGLLAHDNEVLSEFSAIDVGGTLQNIGMLAFHVNSKTFGSSKTPGDPDNGLDFSNVKIEVLE